MEIFPDAAHLPALESALTHPNPAIHRTAQRALVTQYQTPEWEALLIRLLSADQIFARSAGVTLLAARAGKSMSIADALRARLAVEADETLQAQINAVLNTT